MAESLLAAVRHAQDVELVEGLLSAAVCRQELDKLGPTGVNALGLAVWRNHEGLVGALLAAGADPDARDGEAGWSSLHRALHWGNLRVAAALLRANASLAVPDWRGRTPLDLLSAELAEFLAGGGDGDVFAWGSGANYTLGTGATDVALHPARLEGLHDQQVACVAAAKFHSAAVTADGRLLTWGWGRGGRLGHPDPRVHSGEGAVIAPAQVAGLGRRPVAAVAAGKHHTLLCTAAGEVFSMGANRHGQLGYAADSQPTPRRVAGLRARCVALAAANKHSVAVTAAGDVYTWGCNVLGQLGYGTSDSAANAAPRLVEAMRGKPVAAAAAAKRHTLVLTAGGEVYCWGHRGVSPRRVQLAGARDAATAAGAAITFHRGHADVARPLAVAVAAGAAHSSALTAAGVVLTWRSADPALQVQEVGGGLAGRRVVSISAGKYRTAAVSDCGDVWMWEGRSDYFPAEGRQPGSGSKKPAGAGATKARPIPGVGGRVSLGGEPAGGAASCGEPGSGGSLTRRPGSFFERFVREREAGSLLGSSPLAGGSLGGSCGVAGSVPGSAGRPSRASDVFEQIRPERVEGLKRVAAVAVGEKHSLAVQRWSAAQLDGIARVPWLLPEGAAAGEGGAAGRPTAHERWLQQDGAPGEGGGLATPRGSEAELSGLDGAPSPCPSPGRPSPVRPGPRRAAPGAAAVGVPTLQRICEEEVARRLVDPRTCLQVLEYADVAGAEVLAAYCCSVAVCNLDAVLLEAGGAFEELPPHLLAQLERLYKLRLAGAGRVAAAAGDDGAQREAAAGRQEPAAGQAAGSARRAGPPRFGSLLLPGRRPTAAAPWLGDGEEAEGCAGSAAAAGCTPPPAAGASAFRDREQAETEAAAQRLLRTLQKKLQQIEALQARAAGGQPLDAQQVAKVRQRPVLQSAAAALQGGMALADVHAVLAAAAPRREADASAAPGSSSKPKGRGKQGGAADAAAGPSRAQPSPSPPCPPIDDLAGTSPPTSTLVPAFGAAGYAAPAATEPTPALPATPGSAGQPLHGVRSQVGFDGGAATDGVAAAAQRPAGQQQPPGGKPKSAAKRKGGLSMFLRGELEAGDSPPGAPHAEASGSSPSPPPAPTPTPAPAWGAAAAAPLTATASLKQILDQEAAGQQQQHAPQHQPPSVAGRPPTAQRGTPGAGTKSRAAHDSPGTAAPLRLSLGQFIQSSPVAVQRHGASPSAPAWGGAAGASPPTHASFAAIQREQQAAAPPRPAFGTSPPAVQRPGAGLAPWRPPQPPTGASPGLLGSSPSAAVSLLGTSPSGRAPSFLAAPVPQHSKWYVPEERRADRASLASIQSEEEARREEARLELEALRLVAEAERAAAAEAAAQQPAGKPKPRPRPKPARAAERAEEADAGGDPRRAAPRVPRPGGRKRQDGRQEGTPAAQDSGSRPGHEGRPGGARPRGGKPADRPASDAPAGKAGGGRPRGSSPDSTPGGAQHSRGGRPGRTCSAPKPASGVAPPSGGATGRRSPPAQQQQQQQQAPQRPTAERAPT